MLNNTRRRALGLLFGAAAGMRFLPSIPSAFAKTGDCFALKPFGEWKGVATNTQAGAQIGQIEFSDPEACDLRGTIQVASSFDAKLVLFGDPEGTRLPKTFLIQSDNRLIVRNEDGTAAVDEPLCGVCTNIRDDKVSIVLPLATAPLFRSNSSLEIAVKLGGTKECSFTVNCEDLRKALDWATEQKDALASSFEAQDCTPPPQGCFLTTACCEILGLDDECFELAALRRYRDHALATLPGGPAAIATYYRVAPTVLERLPRQDRTRRLLSLYARFILPAAIAARLGLNRLAYRLYARMMHGLAREFAPEIGHLERLPADRNALNGPVRR
ncbi:MAG: CFI-box-CTERM domain-containing protein [Methyloceanibacter sp.]